MVSVVPSKTAKHNFKQSPYEHLPSLPMRGIIAGPSGGGKGVLTHAMLMDFYRGCFDRMHYFSASADLDPSLQVIKEYCEKELEMKEECLHSEWDEELLAEIIENQRKALHSAKREGRKYLPQLLIVCDDFADNPKAVRGPVLKSLFIRGRHMGISTLVLSQKLRLIEPAVRVNCTFMCVFRLRNYGDLAAVVEELSALANQKTIKALYDKATSQPYGFLYINLQAKSLETTFYRNFEASLVPASNSSFD